MEDTTVESTGAGEATSALESEFKQLRQRHKARFEQLASLMSSIQSLSESAKAESDSLETLEQSAQGQLNYLKKSLEETVSGRGEFEARIQELTEALAAGEQERAALAEQLSASSGSSAELDALRGELATSSMALAAAKDQLASVSTQLEEARSEASAAKERLATLEQESAGRNDDAAALEAQIAALKSEIAEKDQLLQNAQCALDEAQDAQGRVAAEFERLKSIQQSAEATQEGLKTELLAVQRELESLKERYREGLSSDAALALRQQVTETAAQVSALERELADAREQAKKSFLAQQLTEAVQESERLEEENQRLRQQLGLLEDGRKRMDGDYGLETAAVLQEPLVSRSPEDELLRIQRSAQKWTHGPKRVIGQILLDAGVINESQLEMALELQKSNPQQHLGALIGELGFASEEAIAQARASQCGVEYIRIAEDTIDPEAAALINLRLATQHNCIPVSATPDAMVLAVTNPMDLLAIEDVERFTNRKVDIVVGTVPDVAQAITRFYWEPE
jgi:chromosome segregation ATPase